MINFKKFDETVINIMGKWGVLVLRISLGIVFLWFGLLKVFNQSPVMDLIQNSYPFFTKHPWFYLFLGIWEVAIGLGLILRINLRVTIGLLWLQMLGVFLAPLFNPLLFFKLTNPLLLTLEGEFLIKNIVLIAATLVIAGHEFRQM